MFKNEKNKKNLDTKRENPWGALFTGSISHKGGFHRLKRTMSHSCYDIDHSSDDNGEYIDPFLFHSGNRRVAFHSLDSVFYLLSARVTNHFFN